MPTGYTADVGDGKVTEFRDFVGMTETTRDAATYPPATAESRGSRGSNVFMWDDKPVATMGALLDAACEAQRDGRAREFLAAYEQANEHARHNLGYVIGYVEPAERRQELYEAFALSHPVFGGRP